LALVAVFSFYSAFRGYRSILRKQQAAQVIDWAAALLTLSGGLGLIVLGVHPFVGVPLPAPVVSLAFGILGVLVSGVDIWRFLRPPAEKMTWWYSHMGGMLGSYIATVSAFSAVNFHFLPAAVRWLWLSVIGVPAIFLWVSYYRGKFNRRAVASAATQS